MWCGLPWPLEFHTVAWLHIPLRQDTGAVEEFPWWDEPVVLRIIMAVVQGYVAEDVANLSAGCIIPTCATRRGCIVSVRNPASTPPTSLGRVPVGHSESWLTKHFINSSKDWETTVPIIARGPNARVLPISLRDARQPQGGPRDISRSAEQTERARSTSRRRLCKGSSNLQRCIMAINNWPTACQKCHRSALPIRLMRWIELLMAVLNHQRLIQINVAGVRSR